MLRADTVTSIPTGIEARMYNFTWLVEMRKYGFTIDLKVNKESSYIRCLKDNISFYMGF